MCNKVELQDGRIISQERPRVQEVIADLKIISKNCGFKLDDSLFRVDEDSYLEEIEQVSSEDSELSEK